jgi:hypothetical protein
MHHPAQPARWATSRRARLRPEDTRTARERTRVRLEPEHFDLVAGCTARRRIPAGQGIRWEDLLDRG